MSFVRHWLHILWQSSPSLTATAMVMLVAFVLSVSGLLIDDRVIGCAPAWLKPAKFAISTAIYALTLAWVFTYLPDWCRLRGIGGFVTAVVLLLEVAIIDIQAWRGLASHFNTATPLDSRLYGAMGTGILIVWAVSVIVVLALFRQRFPDAATGWAIRLGMAITVVGAATGGLMTRPTEMQMDAFRAGHKPPAIGAHTVGAPDGLPGLPGTDWSRDHGDLRVPHFIGLHGAQIVPFVVWCFRGRKPVCKSIVFFAAGSYLALYLLVLWQALNGHSVVRPDPLMAVALVSWLTGTAVALAMTLRERRTVPARDRAPDRAMNPERCFRVQHDRHGWLVVAHNRAPAPDGSNDFRICDPTAAGWRVRCSNCIRVGTQQWWIFVSRGRR